MFVFCGYNFVLDTTHSVFMSGDNEADSNNKNGNEDADGIDGDLEYEAERAEYHRQSSYSNRKKSS